MRNNDWLQYFFPVNHRFSSSNAQEVPEAVLDEGNQTVSLWVGSYLLTQGCCCPATVPEVWSSFLRFMNCLRFHLSKKNLAF